MGNQISSVCMFDSCLSDKANSPDSMNATRSLDVVGSATLGSAGALARVEVVTTEPLDHTEALDSVGELRDPSGLHRVSSVSSSLSAIAQDTRSLPSLNRRSDSVDSAGQSQRSLPSLIERRALGEPLYLFPVRSISNDSRYPRRSADVLRIPRRKKNGLAEIYHQHVKRWHL